MRLLAHHILFDGCDYGFAIADFCQNSPEIVIKPFVEETADTVFVSGAVEIFKVENGFSWRKCRIPEKYSGKNIAD